MAKRLGDAKASYEKALAILDGLEGLGEERATLGRAGIYHNLGVVARDQRRLAEAEGHHRQALEIKLDFGDRHRAAGTYDELGRVAQDQRRLAEAEGHYRQALETYLAFGDRHRATIVLRTFARLWREDGIDTVPRTVAEILGSTPAEAEALLKELLDDGATG